MKIEDLFPEMKAALSKVKPDDPKSLKRVRRKLEKKVKEIDESDYDEEDELFMRKWQSWAESKILWIKHMERDAS